jgi:hypothetical protein
MFIDSLTITALVIFVVTLAVIVRFCVFSLCGGPTSAERDRPPQE